MKYDQIYINFFYIFRIQIIVYVNNQRREGPVIVWQQS